MNTSLNRFSLTYPTLPRLLSKKSGFQVVNYWPCLLCGASTLRDSSGVQVCSSLSCFLKRVYHAQSADQAVFNPPKPKEDWKEETRRGCKANQKITPLDVEILRGLQENKLLKTIGEELGTTYSHVCYLAYKIYRKLGAQGKRSAVAEAVSRGILHASIN